MTVNIPDKILTTAFAFAIIFSYFKVPNFETQRQWIDERASSDGIEPYNRSKYLIFIFVSFLLYCLFIDLFKGNGLWIVAVISTMFVGFFGIAEKRATRSLDPYTEHAGKVRGPLFFDGASLKGTGTLRKDVFEDTFKVVLALFVVSQFFVNVSVETAPAKSESAGTLPPTTAIDEAEPQGAPETGATITITEQFLKPEEDSKELLEDFEKNQVLEEVALEKISNEQAINFVIDGRLVNRDIPTLSRILLFNIILITFLRYLLLMIQRLTKRFYS